MINIPDSLRDKNSLSLANEKLRMQMLNDFLGDIEITTEEAHSLVWLCGWETSTLQNIISVFRKAEDLRHPST